MKKKGTIQKKWMRCFQKKVFQLEGIKFKIIDKLFPNYDEYLEKRRKKILKRQLEIAETEEERAMLIESAKTQTLEIKKEKHRRENMNYHLDMNNPQKTLFWLDYNKQVHKRGLKKNLIKFPILIALLIGSNIIGFGPLTTSISILSILGLITETISTFINTNCVLLQNYNIERVNRYIEGPYKRQRQKFAKQAIEYSGVTSVVSQTLRENEEIPQVEDVIQNISTSEQAKQLLELIQQEMNYRGINKEQKGQAKVMGL